MRRGKLGILYEASLIVGTRPYRENCREDKSKSRFRLHDASSPKFACSSFKDVHGLLSEDESNCSNNKSSGVGNITLDSPTYSSGSPTFAIAFAAPTSSSGHYLYHLSRSPNLTGMSFQPH
ncbi:Uncharacterized protein Fot_10142 [Forsythia ovata]|uniref:Uncharacterized protein n=1 Tax=Forsythia ovata TaxID=205694 RepID=A0ABD1WGC0_9LAMI